MTVSYEKSPYRVRDDLAAAHDRVWDRIARPGTWLDGGTRVRIAAETRHARSCEMCARQKAALSPFAVDGIHQSLGDLPDVWVEVIHRIVSDPGRLTRSWSEKMRASGLEDTEYVELVSIVAHTTAIDVFTRGLGLAQHPLPDPQPGEPSRYRPAEARKSDAWLPTIAWNEAGPNEQDFCQGRESNIRRALTLVPDEARSFFDLGSHQYLSGAAMREYSKKIRAISRAQIELLAGRVSAINQCTY